MTPHDLIDAAKDLMQRPDAPVDGIWPRAAALLARQALEAAIGELWASKPLSLSPLRTGSHRGRTHRLA